MELGEPTSSSGLAMNVRRSNGSGPAADQGLDRIEPGKEARLHVGHAGTTGNAVGVDRVRSLAGRARVEDRVHVADEQHPRPARRPQRPVKRGDDRLPEPSGRVRPFLDPGAERAEESRDEAADLVNALGRVRAAVDVDEALEVGQIGGVVGGDGLLEGGQLLVGGAIAGAGRGGDRHAQSLGSRAVGRAPARRNGVRAAAAGWYPARTVRLVEIRLLEGPNVYRLEPVVKVEVAIGRRRTWYGQRSPGRHALVHLGAEVPARNRPIEVDAFVSWVRRLRADHGEGGGGVQVHRSSDPGHWIVSFPWTGAERARTIAEAALALTERDVSPVRRARLTGAQERLVDRWTSRISAARATPPAWIRDSERRFPIVSITGTNGKSTVTRLITHILRVAGKRVGTTTSDGVLVDERLVEAGDWTGPAGAWQILGRSDLDVGVLETARGGLVLRGMGYESNDASVVTNVSSDHLDLQGIHTLPELAEVKSTVARATREGGWVVLNADDPLVAAMSRRVRANVAVFSIGSGSTGAAVVRRVVAGGGRAYVLRDDWLLEIDGHRAGRAADDDGSPIEHRIIEVDRVPITLGGVARHNVANALAAAGAARGLGVTLAQLRDGLADFQPSSESSPGRLNLFRLGARIVIVDFAHNEAGVNAVLDVAEGIAGGAAGRSAPVTAIIGTAGDRPDDTLRGIGKIAGRRAQRVAIKETLKYLRGRSRESIVGEILAGVTAAGRDPTEIPIYESETQALRAELAWNGNGTIRPDAARVVVLMCHEEREEVLALLAELGARPVDVSSELTTLIPRFQGRPRRG